MKKDISSHSSKCEEVKMKCCFCLNNLPRKVVLSHKEDNGLCNGVTNFIQFMKHPSIMNIIEKNLQGKKRKADEEEMIPILNSQEDEIKEKEKSNTTDELKENNGEVVNIYKRTKGSIHGMDNYWYDLDEYIRNNTEKLISMYGNNYNNINVFRKSDKGRFYTSLTCNHCNSTHTLTVCSLIRQRISLCC